MSNILVFADFQNGQLKKNTLGLLTAARKSSLKIHAVVVGTGAKSVCTELAQNGVDQIFVSENNQFDQYNSEFFSKHMAEIVKSLSPKYVLASSHMAARDLFPRIAAQLKSGVVSDCTELSFEAENAIVKKPMYSGKCLAQVDFKSSGTQFVLMRANQLAVEASSKVGSGQQTEIKVESLILKTLIKEVVKGASNKLDLTEANIIVSGGRGMKNAESFKLLEDLANVLGASVGASRAVVDEGWVPHSYQVGQTGKTVAPSLYIACGISGAIQHLAGMSGSKVIVAINKDPQAPIFQKATYGIVGDVFEVLPVLTAEFQKILQH